MEVNRNRVLIELSGSPRTQFGKIDYAQQSATQRVFSAIWELESDVNNDGFTGYFLNCDTAEVDDIVAALRTIGANRAAEIVSRAIAVFLHDRRLCELEGIQWQSASAEAIQHLNQLDEEFFSYPDDLTDLLYEFVKANPHEFGSVP